MPTAIDSHPCFENKTGLRADSIWVLQKGERYCYLCLNLTYILFFSNLRTRPSVYFVPKGDWRFSLPIYCPPTVLHEAKEYVLLTSPLRYSQIPSTNLYQNQVWFFSSDYSSHPYKTWLPH